MDVDACLHDFRTMMLAYIENNSLISFTWHATSLLTVRLDLNCSFCILCVGSTSYKLPVRVGSLCSTCRLMQFCFVLQSTWFVYTLTVEDVHSIC
eukprot:c46499_g1_i1 orf=2-283(-)